MITSALAEATATTTSSSYSAAISLDFSTVLTIIFVGYFLIMGLGCLFTGKVYGLGRSASKYTDESLAKFARPYGCSLLVVAVGIGVMDLYLDGILANKTLAIVGGVVTVIGLALMGLCYKKFLVKKDQK